MFIDFEGIDGSGKTTLSNRVAARLRQLGHEVTHARENGALSSPIAEKIRALTRDVRHLALCETAELLLYAAREAQSLEEVIRPALQRGEWVIADRYVYSHLALARNGRGLEADPVWKVLEFAAGGVFPDLVIFVDVDPAIARARKRSQKVRDRRLGDSSRKGQGGAGLSAKVRLGVLAMAEADPSRWIIFDNTWGTLEEAEDALVQIVLEHAQRLQRREAIPSAPSRPARYAPGAVRTGEPPTDAEGVRHSFLSTIDGIAEREPALAAHLLTGLSGQDVDERRLRLSRFAPEVVAYGISGLLDEGSMALRHALKAVEPGYVARSLAGLFCDESFSLRDELLERAPAEVARSLNKLADPRAWALRMRLMEVAPAEVLASLATLDDEEAWSLRERLAERAGPEALAASLKGIDSTRAWELRDRLLPSVPLAVIEGLAGVFSAQAQVLRERYMKRAPRAVLQTLVTIDEEWAWRLREAAAEQMREAVESTAHLGCERAWALRERLANVWPGATIKSMVVQAHTPRGRALMFRLLQQRHGELDPLRRSAWVLDPARKPNPPLPLRRTA